MIRKAQSVLVTGASGAVGTAVIRKLRAEGFHVRAMVRRTAIPSERGIELVTADLADCDTLAKCVCGITFAVHCAATLSADETLCRRTNVLGTANLVEALITAGCKRLVSLSSVSVYDMSLGWDLNEDSPLWSTWSSPYGRSKVEAECIVAGARGRGLESVILRPVPVLSLHPTSFWGPLALERSRHMSAPVFSYAELPFVHADNLAEAVVLALRSHAATGRVYNVIDGYGETVAYLAALSSVTGRPAPILQRDAPRMRVAGERFRIEVGYTPTDRFGEFLAQLSIRSTTSARNSELQR